MCRKDGTTEAGVHDTNSQEEINGRKVMRVWQRGLSVDECAEGLEEPEMLKRFAYGI